MLFYDYLWLEKSIICTICFPSSILNASLKKRHYIELCAVWWIWNRLNWGTEYPKLQKKKKKVSRPYLSPCRPHRWSLRSPHLFAPSDAVVTNHTVPLLDSLGPPEKQRTPESQCHSVCNFNKKSEIIVFIIKLCIKSVWCCFF